MKIYSMNVTSINPDDEKWYKYLSPKRIEKVNRLKPANKKAQSIGVELLLRRAVNEITGEDKNAEWGTDERGKLYLTEHPEIHVNLSHSGDWAVCAVHDAPVGIDIQKMNDYDERIANRFFTADEAEYIKKSADKKSAFYTVWTRKESLLKATGKGLTVALSSVSVLADTVIYEGVSYTFKEYSIGGEDYKCFVCFSGLSPE